MDQPLVEMVAEEIKIRRQARSCWLVEIIGAVHDVGAKALGEAINRHLQLALPSKGTEKVELQSANGTKREDDNGEYFEGPGFASTGGQWRQSVQVPRRHRVNPR